MKARPTMFNPGIRGLEWLLPQTSNQGATKGTFQPSPSGGLNIVVCGPAGAGKSILAAQMAVAAARGQGQDRWNVVYLTKDIAPDALLGLVQKSFWLFGEKEPQDPRESGWATEFTLAGTDPAQKICFADLDVLMDLLAGRKKVTEKASKPEPPAEAKKPAKEGAAISSHAPTVEEVAQMTQGASKKAKREFGAVWTGQDPLFALASFAEGPAGMANLVRYAVPENGYEALGCFQPELRPVFDIMAERSAEKGPGLFVVCDSLSPKTVEYHLKAQTQLARLHRGQPGSKAPPSTIFLFVMESSELPEAMAASFPPDVLIRLGLRQESHGVNTRTIRLVKTRFQKSLDEEAPFVILGARDEESAGEQKVIRLGDSGGSATIGDPGNGEPKPFAVANPGIEILPPIAHELPVVRPTPERKVLFHIAGPKDSTAGLEGFTQEGNLAGGGCTLVVTQNRCGSTALSLHYLLAQVAAGIAKRDAKAKAPSSVLYISFSGDVTEVLHTIWRYPLLRKALSGSANPAAVQVEWRQLELLVQNRSGGGKAPSDRRPAARHSLYIMKFKNQGGYLYVYIPDFAWVTPEEAMERVGRLLPPGDGGGGGRGEGKPVQRVVLDRVGRMPARWPLVEKQNVFVSGVVALCAGKGAELMLIDDTAESTESGGTFHSQWVGAAQNIIRLRRVPFYGAEAKTIELVKASGRIITCRRPQEVVFHSDATGFGDRMSVEDSFCGYTGVSVGRPERCKLEVDLTYDEERTLLHQHVMATKAEIQATVDEVTVNALGPGTWSGISSALHNLSSASRDTCRVVAVDGIELGRLLRAGILHRFTRDDLLEILPPHIGDRVKKEMMKERERKKKAEKEKKPATGATTGGQGAQSTTDPGQHLADSKLDGLVDQHYVTQSLTAAIIDLKQNRPPAQNGRHQADTCGFFHAIPLRHNWGLLAVSQPSAAFVPKVFEQIAEALSKEEAGEERFRGLMLQTILDSIAGRPDGTGKRAGLVAALKEGDEGKFRKAAQGVVASMQPPGTGAPPPTTVVLGDADVKRIWAFCRAAPAVLSVLCVSDEGTMKSLTSKVGQGGKPEEDMLVQRVWTKIWGDRNQPISYEDLADFRTNYWHDFWCGGWVQRTLSKMMSEQGGLALDLWVALFPRIDFFGLSLASPESAASFLLEVLLAGTDQKAIFNDATVALLELSTGDQLKAGLAEALRLFYRLLSKSQRRRIALGLRSSQGDDEFRLHNRLVAVSHYHERFAEWPSQICLFSREWITTVKYPLQQYDVRERVDLAPLPTGGASHAYWNALLPKKSAARRSVIRNKSAVAGPTVAGTWYLTVLRGGNTDLAKDVMKEILSRDHEQEGLRNHFSGPVSTEFYPKETKMRVLPYMEVIGQLFPQKQQGALRKWFPFDRTRIKNYKQVSLVLQDLIRQAMRVEKEEEGALRSGTLVGKLKDARTAWETDISNLATEAVTKLIAAQAREPL